MQRRTASIVAIAALACSLAFAMHAQTESIPYDVHEVPEAWASDAANGGPNDETSPEERDDAHMGSSAINWQELDDNTAAWVRIPKTTVDYPIMLAHSDDADFYLTHDSQGRESAWGAPYIDAECTDGLESPLVIVCGHNMSDGTMFALLANYANRDYAEEHRKIDILTRGGTRHLEVFAVDVVEASIEGKRTEFANACELQSFINERLSSCEVILGGFDGMGGSADDAAGSGQIWAFVTCSYQTANSRTIVYAQET